MSSLRVLQVAEYKGEYYRHHPVIENFWEVFLEFPINMKKKFLGMLAVYFILELKTQTVVRFKWSWLSHDSGRSRNQNRSS